MSEAASGSNIPTPSRHTWHTPDQPAYKTAVSKTFYDRFAHCITTLPALYIPLFLYRPLHQYIVPDWPVPSAVRTDIHHSAHPVPFHPMQKYQCLPQTENHGTFPKMEDQTVYFHYYIRGSKNHHCSFLHSHDENPAHGTPAAAHHPTPRPDDYNPCVSGKYPYHHPMVYNPCDGQLPIKSPIPHNIAADIFCISGQSQTILPSVPPMPSSSCRIHKSHP